LKQAISRETKSRYESLFIRPESPSIIAAALHPSYGHLDFLDEATRNEVWENVLDWMYHFGFQGNGNSASIMSFDEYKGLSKVGPYMKNERNSLRSLFESADHREVYDIEESSFDPSLISKRFKLFWNKSSHQFPTCCPIALGFNAIPATSASVERIFSKAGRVKTKGRSELGDKTFEMLIVVSRFFQSQYAKKINARAKLVRSVTKSTKKESKKEKEYENNNNSNNINEIDSDNE